MNATEQQTLYTLQWIDSGFLNAMSLRGPIPAVNAKIAGAIIMAETYRVTRSFQGPQPNPTPPVEDLKTATIAACHRIIELLEGNGAA